MEDIEKTIAEGDAYNSIARCGLDKTSSEDKVAVKFNTQKW